MAKKVFISSTSEDLKAYRDAAQNVVLRYKCKLLAMEYFGAQAKTPKKVCFDEVKDCDIFVGIYAYRYGFIPDGDKESITHQEYNLAKELGKPCLCFVIKEGHPWNPTLIDYDKMNRSFYRKPGLYERNEL